MSLTSTHRMVRGRTRFVSPPHVANDLTLTPLLVLFAAASLAASMTLSMNDMTGNLQRKVQVTMAFGATEILVTALDLTSGADRSVKLSFLGQSGCFCRQITTTLLTLCC